MQKLYQKIGLISNLFDEIGMILIICYGNFMIYSSFLKNTDAKYNKTLMNYDW
jgi:hypothetical protein